MVDKPNDIIARSCLRYDFLTNRHKSRLKLQFGRLHRRGPSSRCGDLELEAGEVHRGGDPHRGDHSGQDNVRQGDEPAQEGSGSGKFTGSHFKAVLLIKTTNLGIQ